jgi:hypothetical protein
MKGQCAVLSSMKTCTANADAFAYSMLFFHFKSFIPK